MRILADIGGTYIRLATEQDGEPQNIQKYKASDFKSLGEALTQYRCDQKGELLIAAAGAKVSGKWMITNNPDWSIEAEGRETALTLNDFEATAYSLPILKGEDLHTIKKATPTNKDLCVIGAGTGLGLAYMRNNSVQKTHGGHMPIASLNDTHGKVIKELRSHQNRAMVFEDIVSGPALQKLRALYDEDKALELFHDFLGIFAATALISGNAFDGLYLTGGVITDLHESNQFDENRFIDALCFKAAPCVRQDLQATPIHIITDPFPALKGLIHAYNKA